MGLKRILFNPIYIMVTSRLRIDQALVISVYDSDTLGFLLEI